MKRTKEQEKERKETLSFHIAEYLDDKPAVYCGTYKKYNEGNLEGAWLDLSTFDNYDEFLEICALLHDDEKDPEFMFQDYQNFPYDWYCESCPGKETFDKIIEYCKLSEDEREIVDAYMRDCGDKYCTVSEVLEFYCGEFDSKEAFAEHIVSECYNLDSMMGNLSSYFDYERYARDLFMTDYVFCDGYVFSNR